MPATPRKPSAAQAQDRLVKNIRKPGRPRGSIKFGPADPEKDARARPGLEELRIQVANIMTEKIRSDEPHALDRNRRRAALRSFMKTHEMSASGWCKASGVSLNVVLNFVNGHAMSLSARVYDKLATAAEVPVSRINGDEEFVEAAGIVSVIGYVAAGDFQSDFPDMADEELYSVQVPLPEAVQSSPINSHVFGLEVRGESMNRFYLDGSVAVCLPVWAVSRDLRSGDHVIAEREDADGSVEATVKEFVIDDDGQGWLWPRSDNPLHQTPVRLDEETTREVKVTAFVVGSYNSAPNF